ncbi:hypothetical protein OG874_21285 [Nocardia sp. NBC_00565]|nr:hypothetical protein [Nocardia sp. NBC_00565]WUC07464.1 hypothetical protein OG874_21285 [Nocardia sp. NBC_00565]
MEPKNDLLIAVEQLESVRGRLDAEHSDTNSDGHGSSGGDGLNIPES